METICSMLAAAVVVPGVVMAAAGQLEPGQRESDEAGAVEVSPQRWSHRPVEVRGVWMATRDMLAPREQIERRLDDLAAANFNTVLINTWFRGYVSYPGSEVAPQYPELEGQDLLGWLIEQCHARGMRTELWFEYGFYAYHTRDAMADESMGPLLDEHPELVAVDSEGRRFLHNPAWGDYYSLCPSNPESHDLLARMMAEAVGRYAADGLNLDRIRYPAENYCCCPYCREHFEKETGIELGVVDEGSAEAERWLEWKRERTAAAVAHIRATVHEVRPGLPMTAYVVGPEEMDGRAQGWDLWMERGLLEGVGVSMYGHDVRPAAREAIERLGGDTSKLIYAISAERRTRAYLANIEASREIGGLGQFTWFLGALGEEDLAGLREGAYRRSAESPFGVVGRERE